MRGEREGERDEEVEEVGEISLRSFGFSTFLYAGAAARNGGPNGGWICGAFRARALCLSLSRVRAVRLRGCLDDGGFRFRFVSWPVLPAAVAYSSASSVRQGQTAKTRM